MHSSFKRSNRRTIRFLIKMKYLFIFLSFTCFAQSPADLILEEYYTDAANENFYPRSYIEQNLKGIYFVSGRTIEKYVGKKDDKRAGTIVYSFNDLTGKTDVLILIDKSKIEKLQNAKAFVYHELGHFLGLGHEMNVFPAIMNEQINGSYLTPETLRYYFQDLRNTPPNNYRKQL